MRQARGTPRRALLRAAALAAALWQAGPAIAADGAGLVERGRRLFTQETFAGNGRTCATCHRPDNNYTIDPRYIARLPASDPLFVAERVPALRDLERPKALRELGLVTVRRDGPGRPAVVRAVPHLFGLRRSTRPEPGRLTPPDGSRDLSAALGWAGDGAPGRGGLRDFVTAAVPEHLTKSMARVAGRDYRAPTAPELDALEAFLLSLDDAETFDLSDGPSGLRFTAPAAERGRQLFNDEATGPCASCHVNGGALDERGRNLTVDIGIHRRLVPPLYKVDPGAAGDAGFGVSPRATIAGRAAHGDGRFNTPSLVHAADTLPLFHDHSSESLEAAVVFYISSAFNLSPEGRARQRVELTEPEIVSIAALLRTLNAMENISASGAKLRRVLGSALADGREPLRLAVIDTEDALEVLAQDVSLYRGPVKQLRQALALERQAAAASSASARDGLLRRAAQLQAQARAGMVR